MHQRIEGRLRFDALGKCRSGLALLAGAMSLAACDDCPDTFELSESVVVTAGERALLTVPDGELTVTGRERTSTIEVEARGCRGPGARIERDSVGGGLRVTARHADVHVVVPAGIELFVRHGSGDVELRAVGPTRLETRGGDVRIQQVIGGLGVRSGPGTLYVRDVMGEVELADGPGAIFVENVSGSVRVRDGSGGIHLREIEGDAVVEGDGSGSIEARSIAGDFVVRSKLEERRTIRYDDVGGRVDLPTDH